MKRRRKVQRNIVAVAAVFFFALAVSYIEYREIPVWVCEEEDLCMIQNGPDRLARYVRVEEGRYIYDLKEEGNRTIPCRRSEKSVPLSPVFLISSFFTGRMLQNPAKGHFFACIQSYILSLVRTLCELMILQKKDGKKRMSVLEWCPAGARKHSR